jgi:hypothetical protein
MLTENFYYFSINGAEGINITQKLFDNLNRATPERYFLNNPVELQKK